MQGKRDVVGRGKEVVGGGERKTGKKTRRNHGGRHRSNAWEWATRAHGGRMCHVTRYDGPSGGGAAKEVRMEVKCPRVLSVRQPWEVGDPKATPARQTAKYSRVAQMECHQGETKRKAKSRLAGRGGKGGAYLANSKRATAGQTKPRSTCEALKLLGRATRASRASQPEERRASQTDVQKCISPQGFAFG